MSTSPLKKSKESPVGELHYFSIRGRGETIRLLLAANQLSWTENTTFEKELSGTASLPFGQWPLWSPSKEDKDLDSPLSQMDAICRHLGRKTGWYGKNAKEDARTDEILSGVESLRSEYVNLIYRSEFDGKAFASYLNLHVKPTGLLLRNSGAHFAFLENILQRSKTQWASGGEHPSIADVAVFDLVDLHVHLFANNAKHVDVELFTEYPKLGEHRNHFMPLVKDYLASSLRLPKANGNDRG